MKALTKDMNFLMHDINSCIYLYCIYFLCLKYHPIAHLISHLFDSYWYLFQDSRFRINWLFFTTFLDVFMWFWIFLTLWFHRISHLPWFKGFYIILQLSVHNVCTRLWGHYEHEMCIIYCCSSAHVSKP